MNSLSTDHNPQRRAEASADPRTVRRQQLDLEACAPGIPTWGKWTPVQGPHLKVVRQKHARSRTGVPGISYGTTRHRTKTGGRRMRSYFVVQLGRTTRKFCLESLGRNTAWRKAVECRARHEITVRQINAAIEAARKKATQEKSHV